MLFLLKFAFRFVSFLCALGYIGGHLREVTMAPHTAAHTLGYVHPKASVLVFWMDLNNFLDSAMSWMVIATCFREDVGFAFCEGMLGIMKLPVVDVSPYQYQQYHSKKLWLQKKLYF